MGHTNMDTMRIRNSVTEALLDGLFIVMMKSNNSNVFLSQYFYKIFQAFLKHPPYENSKTFFNSMLSRKKLPRDSQVPLGSIFNYEDEIVHLQ